MSIQPLHLAEPGASQWRAAATEAPMPAPADLSSAEREKILRTWNQTQSPCDTDRCIHWLFEEKAASAPLAPAIDDGRSTISYAELDDWANHIALHLQVVGNGTGSLIGVCLDRSAGLIATLLGILKCGAAYVPIEPVWPDQRIRSILNSLRLDALVTDAGQIGRLNEIAHGCSGGAMSTAVEVMAVPDRGAGCNVRSANAPRAGDPDDRAYIILTSGTSGHPKAVAVQHRAVINLIDWVNETFGVCRDDKLLFTSSVAFDLSVYDIFGILAVGGTIRMASTEDLQDPQRLAAIVLDEPVTFWNSAPAMLERLGPYLSCGGDCSRLRLVFLSGDWIPLHLPPLTKKRFPCSRVIALGGATEATVWSNYFEVGEIDPGWQSIPYGRPIQNTQYYILDAALEPCPIGVAGDLYIGGVCLAQGYANDAELTVRKFIADPFIAGQRMYQTGDRARYLSDGNIELLGRADRQVKIRGFRVELAEIEGVLRRHPRVCQTVVVAQGAERQAKRLVAYVVTDRSADNGLIAQELGMYLERELPKYMVPSRVEVLPSLPLTTSGKPDLIALELLPGRERHAEPAKTACERKLAALWCRVLRLKEVGIHDSFFDLGGDSLQSVEMIAAAIGKGMHLRHQDVVAHPTIARLASLCSIEAERWAEDLPDGPIPLTPTQHWFFARSLSFPERYNAVFCFDVIGAFRLDHLRIAVTHLHTCHDALRLRFKRNGSGWTQFLASEVGSGVTEAWDLSGIGEPQAGDEIQRRVAEMRRGFDLERGPLVKAVRVLRRSGKRTQLLLILHHLVFDGVSLAVLLDDLTTALEQLDSGRRVALAPSGSFASWARQLNTHAQSTAVVAEERYWLNLPWDRLEPLPRDMSTGRNKYGGSRSIAAELSKLETTLLLTEATRLLGASAGEVLLGCCVQTLSAWANQNTILIELTDHGRHDVFGERSSCRTVGYLTSNIPLLISLPAGAAVPAAIEHVHEHLRQMPDRGIGYGVLRYLLPGASHNRLSMLPRPEVKFNYLGALTSEATATARFRPAPDIFAGVLDPQEERAYLHNVEILVTRGKLVLEWKYSSAIHRTSTIEGLVKRFMSSLRGLVGSSAGESSDPECQQRCTAERRGR